MIFFAIDYLENQIIKKFRVTMQETLTTDFVKSATQETPKGFIKN